MERLKRSPQVVFQWRVFILRHESDTWEEMQLLMLSDILVAHKEVESFDQLLPLVQAIARNGERFFRIDVKPPYPDTPEDWEDRLEAAFSGLIR